MEMKSASDLWIEAEENLRKIDPKRICNFGIKAIDDPLLGILPNDLIVLGADSGVGKSEIALNIAVHNAQEGRRVGLYFLEGNAEEAINRIRWRFIKNEYYAQGLTGVDMDYTKWRMGELRNNTIDDLNFDCWKSFSQKVKDRLHIYNFDDTFKIENLINSLGWFSRERPGEYLMEKFYEVDLLIIDHLQFFDLNNPKFEYQEMTEIIKKVRMIPMHYNIPVILVSHLRKKDKDRGLPNQEDFFGTSNIVKMASQAIVLCPYHGKDNFIDGQYPTFFRFVKSRTGIRSNIATLCNFDFYKGEYKTEYEVHRLKGDVPVEEPLRTYERPRWARCQNQNTSQASSNE